MMGRLFLWASGGFLLGNLLVGFDPSQIITVLLLMSAGVIAFSFLFSWRTGTYFLITTLFCGLGFLVVRATDVKWNTLPETVEGSREVVVVKQDSSKAFYQPLIVESLDQEALATRILWRAKRTVELTPGMHVQLDCSLKRPENFDSHFDYRRYLTTQNIGYVCDEEKSFQVLAVQTKWRMVLGEWQRSLKERITTLLPDPAAGLLTGLFLGGDESLPKTVSESFRRAGLSHIVAVSGYNMSLVSLAVLFLALLSGLWRKTATLLAVVGILLFLLLIDTSAASLRAAFMTWIVFFAFFLGRPANAFNGLFFAGLIMVVMNPLLVRYDVGFQLSFMATFMLIAASPWIERYIHKGNLISKILTLFLTTLVIEIGIFPILLFHFGTVSILAPVANLFALPLVPLAMLLGFLMLLFSTLLPLFGLLLAFPVWAILTVLIWIAEKFGSFSWGILESIHPSLSFIVLWYIVLSLGIWYSRKSQERYALRMDY